MSLLRMQEPPPCARTGGYMSNTDIADEDCTLTGERVEDLVCPVRIAGARHPMEHDALLRWRQEERGLAATYGRAVVEHRNPNTRVPYEPADVRLVRFDGQPVEEYNQNVRHLNATLRAGLPPYVELHDRDEAHLSEYMMMRARGRPNDRGPHAIDGDPEARQAELAKAVAQMRLQDPGRGHTLADVAARRHPATQRFMDAAAVAAATKATDDVAAGRLLEPLDEAAHIETAEAARRKRREERAAEARARTSPERVEAAPSVAAARARTQTLNREANAAQRQARGQAPYYDADTRSHLQEEPARGQAAVVAEQRRFLFFLRLSSRAAFALSEGAIEEAADAVAEGRETPEDAVERLFYRLQDQHPQHGGGTRMRASSPPPSTSRRRRLQ